MKPCSRCGIPTDKFPPYKGIRSEGFLSHCWDCHARVQREGRYKLPPWGFENLIEEQGGMCPACGKPLSGRLVLDHDHSCCPGRRTCGKCNRGVLHSNCNVLIGLSGDDPELLYRAADYLSQHVKLKAAGNNGSPDH